MTYWRKILEERNINKCTVLQQNRQSAEVQKFDSKYCANDQHFGIKKVLKKFIAFLWRATCSFARQSYSLGKAALAQAMSAFYLLRVSNLQSHWNQSHQSNSSLLRCFALRNRYDLLPRSLRLLPWISSFLSWTYLETSADFPWLFTTGDKWPDWRLLSETCRTFSNFLRCADDVITSAFMT